MQYDKEYWEMRTDYKGSDYPETVKNAIKRVYESYPPECMPQGLSDPMYIMNVICKELGIGDGQGNFSIPV
jgi:hypothetical protein